MEIEVTWERNLRPRVSHEVASAYTLPVGAAFVLAANMIGGERDPVSSRIIRRYHMSNGYERG